MNPENPQKTQKKHCYQLSLALLLLAAPFLLTQCGKITTTTTPTSGTFASVYSILLSNNCNECHIPTGAATTNNHVTLNFTSATTAYTTLTQNSVTGASSTGTCGTVKIVSAGSLSKSYLIGVLVQSYNISNFAGVTGCTPYSTHLQDTHLSSSDQTSLTTWIQNGALNN